MKSRYRESGGQLATPFLTSDCPESIEGKGVRGMVEWGGSSSIVEALL